MRRIKDGARSQGDHEPGQGRGLTGAPRRASDPPATARRRPAPACRPAPSAARRCRRSKAAPWRGHSTLSPSSTPSSRWAIWWVHRPPTAQSRPPTRATSTRSPRHVEALHGALGDLGLGGHVDEAPVVGGAHVLVALGRALIITSRRRHAASGRFAPSPTGAMHLGNARTALLAWLARPQRRRPRSCCASRIWTRRAWSPGAEARLLDELRLAGPGLGRGPRRGRPARPLPPERARAPTTTPPSTGCWPAARPSSAPARAPTSPARPAPPTARTGPRYPGTCRDARPRPRSQARAAAAGRAPAVRFRGDGAAPAPSSTAARPGRSAGRRRASTTSSSAAPTASPPTSWRWWWTTPPWAITEVVRGDDLLSSTPRQLALYAALGAPPPGFAHVPLVLAPGGRAAGQAHPPACPSADLRQRGVAARRIVGALAASAGLRRRRPGGVARRSATGLRLQAVRRSRSCRFRRRYGQLGT